MSYNWYPRVPVFLQSTTKNLSKTSFPGFGDYYDAYTFEVGGVKRPLFGVQSGDFSSESELELSCAATVGAVKTYVTETLAGWDPGTSGTKVFKVQYFKTSSVNYVTLAHAPISFSDVVVHVIGGIFQVNKHTKEGTDIVSPANFAFNESTPERLYIRNETGVVDGLTGIEENLDIAVMYHYLSS